MVWRVDNRVRKVQVLDFLPADKGGLRRADVSVYVCLSVCSLVDFPLNFTMVMGSFTQKYVLIQTDQSESRDCVWAHSD